MEAPTGDLRSQLIGNTQSDGAVFKTVLFYSVLILLLPIGCFFTTKSIIFETILGQVSFFSVKIVLYDRMSGVHYWDQHRERCSGRDSAASRSRIIYLQGLSSRVAPSPQSSLCFTGLLWQQQEGNQVGLRRTFIVSWHQYRKLSFSDLLQWLIIESCVLW